MNRKWQVSLLFICMCLIGFSSKCFTVQSAGEPLVSENPGKRHGHGLVFVEQSNSLILFGGRRSNGDTSQINRVWNYDLSNGEWSIIETINNISARFNHAMVYVPTTHSILIYGGFNNTDSVAFTDTWMLNLTSLEWQKIISAERPPMKSDCGIAYDSNNDCVLLFGGFQGGVRSNQLWEFNVSDNSWELQNPVNSPAARYGVGFVFNMGNNQSYLFGGRENTIKGDFYKLSTGIESWEELQSEDGPYHRYWHSMVYASTTNEIIVFGGQSGVGDRGMLDDTWIYSFSSENWIDVSKRKAPVARILSPLVFSPDLNRAYMYGGMADDYEQVFEDFWEFDCQSYKWSEVGENQIPIPLTTIILSICVGIALVIRKMRLTVQKKRKKLVV